LDSPLHPLRSYFSTMIMKAFWALVLLSSPSSFAFVSPRHNRRLPCPLLRRAIPPERVGNVEILADADAVSAKVVDILNEAAAAAIKERGAFALAIPGGSILNMLAGASSPSWASKTVLVYVNHKCVAMDDAELATHAKAEKKFLSTWEGVRPILLSGSADSAAEAAAYESALRGLSAETLPLSEDGSLPVFDLALIGVGDDGHVGSLYPGRAEVLEEEKWVLPVDMKKPGSITLSLPVMAAAKKVVIAACGVSEKYPQGKSAGMRRAIEEPETLESFPASGLRGKATWCIDEAAGSKLHRLYRE
jgi:6-phosphogluconolactonase